MLRKVGNHGQNPSRFDSSLAKCADLRDPEGAPRAPSAFVGRNLRSTQTLGNDRSPEGQDRSAVYA